MIEFLSNLISSDLTTIVFLALIVVPIYFKMGILGNKNGNGVPEWAKKLQQHYNEDTTKVLEKINITLADIKEENITHHKFEEGRFELLEEIIKNKK